MLASLSGRCSEAKQPGIELFKVECKSWRKAARASRSLIL